MSLHSIQTKIHKIENWSFANLAARAANGIYATADLGKASYQQDSETYWRLIQVTNPGTNATPSWSFIGGPKHIENAYEITSLSGAEATSLKNKDITNLLDGYKVVTTLNDSDGFYTLQSGAPDANQGDIACAQNAMKRWRKTGGY